MSVEVSYVLTGYGLTGYVLVQFAPQESFQPVTRNACNP